MAETIKLESGKDQYLRVFELHDPQENILLPNMLYLLAAHEKEPSGAYHILEKMKSILMPHQNFNEVKEVVKSLIIYSPDNAHFLLPHLTVFCNSEFNNENTNINFVFGVILGIFEAVIWLHQNWPTCTKFISEYHISITDIIINETKILKRAGEQIKDNLANKFKTKLSSLISELSKHDTYLLKRIVKTITDEDQIKMSFHSLGDLMMREILIKYYTSMPTYGMIHLHSDAETGETIRKDKKQLF